GNGDAAIVCNGLAASTIAYVEVGMIPVRPNVEMSTTPSLSSTLRITQSFEPNVLRWCIGQVAFAPCVQLQSETYSIAGPSMTQPSWHESQTAASGPSTRRRPVIVTLP